MYILLKNCTNNYVNSSTPYDAYYIRDIMPTSELHLAASAQTGFTTV